jgi:Ser/Thr protein kinase RdoA (MazF antagonist)
MEHALAGGTMNAGGVVRVGDTVRRPVGAHSPAVHALLEHLERVGFEGAPRFLGMDERGREVLTFIEGEVPGAPFEPWTLSEETRASVARLLARYHEAVAGFRSPPDARWDSHVPDELAGDVICHADVARENVVCRERCAVALIDFDRAAPADPVFDLASALLQWIPLHGDDGDDVLRAAGRIRSFCDAYGLEPERRLRVLRAISAIEQRGYAWLRQVVAEGHLAYVALWNAGAPARIEQRLGWLRHNDHALRAGLA